MFDSLVAASWPNVDDASAHCMVVVVAVAAVAMEQLTNDVYSAPNHRTHLTRIVLNSFHSYEMDIPYRDTCWALVDLML